MHDLFLTEIHVTYKNLIKGAQDITHILSKIGTECAFCSFTAGSVYSKSNEMKGNLYLYLQREKVDFFMDSFMDNTENGVKVKVYIPDRKVFDETRLVNGVRVVSPEQVLLDLAGMGNQARDLFSSIFDAHIE